MERTITLTGAEIDGSSESLGRELKEKYGCQSKEAKRICLSMEEILLSVRDKFGEKQAVKVNLSKRFGKLAVRISFAGVQFDPRLDSGEMNDLLTMYSLIPDYLYKTEKIR